MKNTIKSWGRKLSESFVRIGTYRRIAITLKPRFRNDTLANVKAVVFVAFSNEGELDIQVSTGNKGWKRLLKVNLDTVPELEE